MVSLKKKYSHPWNFPTFCQIITVIFSVIFGGILYESLAQRNKCEAEENVDII